MSRRRTLTAAVLTTALAMGLGVGSATVATAAPSAATTISAVPTSTAPTTSTPTTLAGALRTAIGATSTPAGPAAASLQLPGATTPSPAWLIAVIVKVALGLIQAASPGTYNTIVSLTSQGLTAFVTWWTTSAPTWVKDLVGTLSAIAVYLAIRWAVGV